MMQEHELLGLVRALVLVSRKPLDVALFSAAMDNPLVPVQVLVVEPALLCKSTVRGRLVPVSARGRPELVSVQHREPQEDVQVCMLPVHRRLAPVLETRKSPWVPAVRSLRPAWALVARSCRLVLVPRQLFALALCKRDLAVYNLPMA